MLQYEVNKTMVNTAVGISEVKEMDLCFLKDSVIATKSFRYCSVHPGTLFTNAL